MRSLLFGVFLSGLALAGSLEDFVASARLNHGMEGERAARFLVENMPPGDPSRLSVEFLTQNLDLALRARAEFPWAGQVPEEIFLNDVLPYAVFDEPRDPWRDELYKLGRELVQGARTGSEAAQALNRQLFNRLNVHYNTGRKRPNQSLKESKVSNKATCTGLSIILVNACRAVGIPARAVGTPLWSNNRGNHTWVEIWDGDWHFAGADEYDPAGLDRGWFVEDAAKARSDVRQYAIYATSWKRDGLTFPMVWSRHSESVAAVNVTARYASPSKAGEDLAHLGVRLWDQRNGNRLAAVVRVMDTNLVDVGCAETRCGTADLNDMARFDLQPGIRGWVRFAMGEETRELAFGPLEAGDATVDAVWAQMPPACSILQALQTWLNQPVEERPTDAAVLQVPLSRGEAEQTLKLLVADRFKRLVANRKDELETRSLTLEGRTMRWLETTFGDVPADGHSLWISMHGGGNAPSAVNDRQWKNQARLYQLEEGIYLAPRAPTDTWNLWHEAHIDPMFQRLIDSYVSARGVNPNRVYLLGYSAGGDGVWQLAPRMADRFAAAAMMAGHPNEASLLGLRNLPFAMFVGAEDGAYHRNEVVADRATQLDQLAKDDPGGYLHMSRVYEGLGHWMEGKDAEALPWMSAFRRNPWPSKIVWQQDDVVHRRFYWLKVPDEIAIGDRSKMVATVEAQTIEVDGDVPSTFFLRLSDRLLDLDMPVTVRIHGQEAFSGMVARTAASMIESLAERADPSSVATVLLRLENAR